MNGPNFSWRGRCRCGVLRFEITRTLLLTMICQCCGCQRLTTNAFSTRIAIPTDGVALIRGNPATR